MSNEQRRNIETFRPISWPQEGVAGQTGSWRAVRPVIDTDKCTRCRLCWIYCPDAAIHIGEDGAISIDYTYCKGCGICGRECPTHAINMEEEAGQV